ncbi:type II toxin-antitoxin system PemK/MazF family toxin [Fischerella sp. JS2]|uniref:type II toxin-antitoxin system PemK/MazF family toxin n=1 Tax=Fischerella sp. JS2 TaxID=2597771 RepID=UPI0028EFC19C|nr:type II toxin-antitoxin system PemK/MazF family toxin [Fischerella sp. JS2]
MRARFATGRYRFSSSIKLTGLSLERVINLQASEIDDSQIIKDFLELSESSLNRVWLDPEEEEAWKDLLPFPFSDSSTTKRRPALVIAESDSNNIIVCPITSKPGRDYQIKLEDKNFRIGKLNLSPCYIRPNIIATVDTSNVIRHIGKLKDDKINEVITVIIEILQKPSEPPPRSKA